MIKELTQKLLDNTDLNYQEAKEAFDEIFQGLSTSLQASSFITALEVKKPTFVEKIASITSAQESVRKINTGVEAQKTIENLSFGVNKKYFDYSLTNDLICASCSLCALRYNFESHVFKSRSFDILSLAGFKFKKAGFDFSYDLERINLGYINLPSDEPFYKYVWEIKRNLDFLNVLSLDEIFLNPYNCKNLSLGVEQVSQVEDFARLAIDLKLENAIVISSQDNLPFVSTEGETFVAEAWKNKIFSYKISPELLEFQSYAQDEIKVENNEHCVQILTDLTENKLQGALFDSIIINAGFSLYISKIASSVIEGIELAKKTVQSGKLKEKYEQIKKFYS